jgi:hypothetical protein
MAPSVRPDGRRVNGDVESVTGHPARPFREWAREHAAEFAPLP